MKVICLDFDGVVCDSAAETATTGWRGATELWPERFRGEPPAAFVAAFRRVRPVIETGYESILLARMIADGVPEATIAAEFRDRCEALCRATGLEAQRLIGVFGRVRDRWLATAADSWLDLHEFYRGVPDLVRARQAAGDVVTVITTKEKRFAEALLARAGLHLPATCLFGLEAGDKRAVLRGLLARPALAGAEFYFVEDRLATLRAVAEVPELRAVHLGFAAWGFCTADQRQAAAEHPRVTLLTLADFASWIGA